MKPLLFPTRSRIAGITLATAAALVTMALLPAMASAQTIESGGQPTVLPVPQTGRPGSACALIYPPPAGCAGHQLPSTPYPDICIQVYPPPAGCAVTPSAPRPAYPSYPQWPSGSQPSLAPSQPSHVGQAPAKVALNRHAYQRGDQVVLRIEGGVSGHYPYQSGYRCDLVELQRWTPGGWVSAPSGGLDCAGAAAIFVDGAPHTWAVPLNQQAGSYRMAIRLNNGYGQQVVYSDTFVIQ